MLPLLRPTQKSNPGIFDDLFDAVSRYDEVKNQPAYNIKETAKDYQIEMAAPGFEKKNFNVDVNNHTLTISAERKEEKEDKGEEYYRRDFSVCNFKRSFELPDNVDEEHIQARYDKGIMNVVIPKTNPREEVNRKVNID